MKNLICEADVAKFAPHRPIVVDGDTVITPSALDRASRLRIPVLRAAGTAASQAAPRPSGEGTRAAEPCPHCVCCALPEGAYLLTVAGGKKPAGKG